MFAFSRFADWNVQVVVWDTAGHTRYDAFVAANLRRADAVLCAFDLTSAQSWAEVDAHHLPIFQSTSGEDVPFLLVGMKADLISRRVVEMETIRDWVEEGADDPRVVGYIETSTMWNVNVGETFELLAILGLRRRLEAIAQREDNSHRLSMSG
jgi:Ras-related protein Rab-5C